MQLTTMVRMAEGVKAGDQRDSIASKGNLWHGKLERALSMLCRNEATS